MRQEHKRILRIANELSTFFISVGATDISTQLHREGQEFTLTLRSDFLPEKRRKVEELSEYFNRNGQYGAVEGYWELIGCSACGDGSELMLIGMLARHTEITVQESWVTLTLSIGSQQPTP